MGGKGSGRRPRAETIAREIEKQRVVAQGQAAVADEMESELEFVPTPVKLQYVKQPTGSTIQVQGDAEREFYERQRDNYMQQYKFTEVSDLSDLDALLLHETLDFRYTSQLASGKAYDGRALVFGEEEQFRQNKLAEAKVIGDLKRQLGITRAARDQQQGNVADYIRELQRRAKEFGVYRDEQRSLSISLMKELESIVTTWQRSNETERRVVGIETEADIVTWILDTMLPRLHAFEAAFLAEQKKWRADL